jgi:hypothetical protein
VIENTIQVLGGGLELFLFINKAAVSPDLKPLIRSQRVRRVTPTQPTPIPNPYTHPLHPPLRPLCLGPNGQNTYILTPGPEPALLC